MKKIIGILCALLLLALPVASYAIAKDSVNAIKHEVINQLMGTVTVPVYIAAFIFALLGMFLRWWFKTNKAIKTNPITPVKFNILWWIRDNVIHVIPSVLATIIIIFISLRFSVEWFGKPVSMILALGVGLFFDFICDKLKNMQPTLAKNIEKYSGMQLGASADQKGTV